MQRPVPVSLALPSPEPTAPPDAILVARRLQHRSASLTTCGWINGDYGRGDCIHRSASVCHLTF